MILFADMDGVVTDFVGGALARHKKELAPSEVRWGFPQQIGFSGVNDPAFWAPLDHDFWASLGWTHEGKELLSRAEGLFSTIVLLTSPCATPGGVEGKITWIRRELPAYRRRFLVGPPKWTVAGPGKVLLDDHDDHVRDFRAGGGEAILVPRPWNARRAEADSQGRFDVSALIKELELIRYGA